MRFQGKRILVVGGAGFVGSNLCHQLLQEGVYELIVVDNLLSSDIDNLPQDSRIQFVFGSIQDDIILMKIGQQYDYVFHLATFHGNQSSIMNPLADHQNNTLTTLKLCEHFKNNKNLIKMVYSSAGCTVAKKTYEHVEATNEDAEISLYHDSPYQMSKIFGEFYGNYYWMKYNLPFVKARFQNVYGPREVLGAGQWRGVPATVWRNVIPTFIWKALHYQSLPLENEGKSSRDFIFVADIVEGLIACAIHGKAANVYNLAPGVETNIRKLAEIINQVCDNKIPLALNPAREWDRSGKRFGSTEKAKKELGFQAKYLLEDGLKETITWTKDNLKFIEQNILKHRYFLPDVLECV